MNNIQKIGTVLLGYFLFNTFVGFIDGTPKVSDTQPITAEDYDDSFLMRKAMSIQGSYDYYERPESPELNYDSYVK
jgi:hypothetical protein